MMLRTRRVGKEKYTTVLLAAGRFLKFDRIRSWLSFLYFVFKFIGKYPRPTR